MKKTFKNAFVSLLMVFCMVLGLSGNVFAENNTTTNVQFQKVQRTDLYNYWGEEESTIQLKTDEVLEEEPVRVFIVFDDESVVDRGFSTINITENAEAMAVSEEIISDQNEMAERISKVALDGEELDVRYNYTLLSNAISATVKGSKIGLIKKIKGVKKVVPVMQYILDDPKEEDMRYESYEDNVNHPCMGIAGTQVNADEAYEFGYSGIGQKIAIVDTGLAIGHPAFGELEYLYSLKEEYDRLGAAAIDYAGINDDILSRAQLDEIWDRKDPASGVNLLHAANFINPEDEDDVYVSAKIPFAVNYVDQDLDVTHENDDETDHGTHVAGIAAANKYYCVTGNDIPYDTDSVLADFSTGRFDERGFEEHERNVKGIAYNAQLLVMKVFGKNGGAYDDDYMAAIEDAIMLGCDSINLSLGSSYAGESSSGNAYYDEVMASLLETDTTVCISAGNSGKWYEYTVYGIFTDGETGNQIINTNNSTIGSPGSYTDAFTVASADNCGAFYKQMFLQNDPDDIDYIASFPYEETSGDYEYEEGHKIPLLESLDTSGVGTVYDYVLLETNGYEQDFEGIDCENKIVFVNIYGNTFSEKVNNAAKAGALAVVIYDKLEENCSVRMNLSGVKTPTPAVNTGNKVARKIKAIGTKHVLDEDTTYYTGTIMIKAGVWDVEMKRERERSVISYFSSFGTNQNLEMKPEITAPGGSILSSTVSEDGEYTYSVYSGTSMAAPNISGQAALLAQYIKKNGLKTERFSIRKLTMGLLMSTATPLMYDYEDQVEYLTRAQGAGLANLGAAMKTPIYTEVTDREDGKVKFEFKDDPERNGVYDLQLRLTNYVGDGKNHYYKVRTSLLTEAIFECWDLDEPFDNIKGEPYKLEEDEQYSVRVSAYGNGSGDNLMDAGVIRVPSTQATIVDISIAINENGKEYLDQFPAGTFVEGYIYLDNLDEMYDGSEETKPTLVVPMLGYYGSFAESPMLDQYVNSTKDPHCLLPYLSIVGDEEDANYFSYLRKGNPNPVPNNYGNPYDIRTVDYFSSIRDDVYIPDRESISCDNVLYSFTSTFIRNADRVYTRVTNAKTGELYQLIDHGPYSAAYCSEGEQWFNSTSELAIKWPVTDAIGNKLSNGTEVLVETIAIPEYYKALDVEDINSEDYPGLVSSQIMTVDNEAPELCGLKINDAKNRATFNLYDNRYVAAVYLMDANQTEILKDENGNEYAFAVNQMEEGEDVSITVDVPSKVMTIVVCDYAGNESAYIVNNSFEPQSLLISSLRIETAGKNDWTSIIKGEQQQLYARIEPDTLLQRGVVWTSSDRNVVTVDENGLITAKAPGHAIIIAYSVATNDMGQHLIEKCEVSVIDPLSVVCNAFVWDEDGNDALSTIDSEMLPSYTQLLPIDEWVTDAQYLGEGQLTYSDGEIIYSSTESLESRTVFYEPDEGCGSYAYSPASGMLYTVPDDSRDYLYIYDVANDEKLGYLEFKNIIGLSFNDNLYNRDMVYVVEEDGDIYSLSLDLTTGEVTTVKYAAALIKCNSAEGGSVYYDPNTELMLISAMYNDYTTLYVVEPVYGATKEMGSLSKDVWPMAGLYMNEGQSIVLSATSSLPEDPDPVPDLQNAEIPAPIIITPTNLDDEDDTVPGTTETSDDRISVNDSESSATASIEKIETPEGENLVLAGITVSGEKSGANTKITLSGSFIKEIVEKAGTENTLLSIIVANDNGIEAFKLMANAADILSGEPLHVLKLGELTEKNGELDIKSSLVNGETYKADANGNIDIALGKKATYILVNEKDYQDAVKEIKASIKPKKSSITVKKGKKTTLVLDKNVDMDNIKSITYSTKNTKVISLTKSGKMTAKKPGTAKVTIKVVLVNGDTKTLTRTIKVK